MGGSPDEAPTACTPEGMGAGALGAGSGFGGATGLAGAAATDSGARASGSDEAAVRLSFGHVRRLEARGLEGEHAQQRHREARVFVGRERKIVSPVNQNLVEKLDFFGRAVLGQTANERALGIVFAHGFGNALHERRAVHDAREVAQDLRETQALREHLVGNAHQTAGVARKKTVKELGEEFRPAHAEHVAHFALGDARRAVRDRLVQKREAVAHGAAGAWRGAKTRRS